MEQLKYVITCFKAVPVELKGMNITLLRPTGGQEVNLRKRLDPITSSSQSLRRLFKDVSCDYGLIQSPDGKDEVLIALNQVKGFMLYPRPRPLKKLQLLKRQEAPEMEENVVFSKTLTTQDLPLDDGYYVFFGDVKLPNDERVVGIKVVTDSGVRILLTVEGLPRTNPIASNEVKESGQVKRVKKRKSGASRKRASRKTSKKKRK